MAAKLYYQEDCNLSVLEGQTIAIIGYGSQGHAHALNLKESGCNVIIGLYEGSKSWAKAEAQGFEVFTAAEAAKKADVIMILINDEKQAAMYKNDIEPNLEEYNEKEGLALSREEMDYLLKVEKFLLRNGANEVVYPEKQLAKWTAIRYSADHILDYIELDENHAMFEIPVPKDWADHSIGELDIRKKFNINIMGIKKSGKLELSISSDTVLKAGDTMLVLGSNRNLQKCFRI